MSTDVPVVAAPATTPATPAHEPEGRFSMAIRLKEHYAQVVDFDLTAVTPMIIDETAPLGWEEGPNPARLLGAAVGGCLGASLLFCLRKARIDVSDLRTTVDGTLVRNARGRLRIGSLRVRLHPTVPAADRERIARCVGLFEDFCIVTESVRHGVEVDVGVEPTTDA